MAIEFIKPIGTLIVYLLIQVAIVLAFVFFVIAIINKALLSKRLLAFNINKNRTFLELEFGRGELTDKEAGYIGQISLRYFWKSPILDVSESDYILVEASEMKKISLEKKRETIIYNKILDKNISISYDGLQKKP